MKALLRIAAFTLALSATGAHAFAGADEATELCFDNANRGASVSFYLYPAKDGKRAGTKIWERTWEHYYDPRRCVSVHQLLKDNYLLQPGQTLIPYYTIEGKIGAAHFACGGVVFMKAKWPVQRMVYTVHGSTAYSFRCERTIENKGRFAHPDGNGDVAVSTVCFGSSVSGARTHFRLHRAGSGAAAWTRDSGRPCVRLDQIKGVRAGDQLEAKIHLRDWSYHRIDCAPKVRVGTDPKGVKSVAEFVAVSTSRCQRNNYIDR